MELFLYTTLYTLLSNMISSYVTLFDYIFRPSNQCTRGAGELLFIPVSSFPIYTDRHTYKYFAFYKNESLLCTNGNVLTAIWSICAVPVCISMF